MRLKKTSTCICLVLVTVAVQFSGINGRAANAAALTLQQELKPEAKKVAEFRPDEGENLKALAEDFAQSLKKEPNSGAYIIFYRPVHSTQAANYRRCNEEYAKDYLAIQGIPESKITAIKGGYRHQAWMEYWIVPQGASAPKPTPEPMPKKRNKKH
jgi:hypothetical protein